VISASWDFNDGQGTAEVALYNGGTVYATDSVAINGISSFAAGLSLQFGPSQQVVSATQAAFFPLFTVPNHGFNNGDTVVFQGLYQTPTTGMPQMTGIPFIVMNVTTNTFTVPWNNTGSNYTALSGSPVGARVKKVLYPSLYMPDVAFIAGASAVGVNTNFITTNAPGFVVGQEIAFRIPPTWGETQLNSLPNNIIPGSPMYGYIISVLNSNTFVCNINSSTFTAFNPNQPVSSLPGLSYPQVVSVGDVNSGGWPYTGAALYPSPIVNGVNTINGPAIQGAFINNTSQGFLIGSGTCVTDVTAVLVGNSGDIIRWRAFLHDYSSP
jgi:hypothetical protein